MRTLALVLALAVSGCEALGQVTDPTVESQDYLMFAIGAVVEDGPPAADFQATIPLGMTHFFDNEDPENPEFLCQHDEEESIAKREELDIPYDLPCAVDTTRPEPRPDPPPPPATYDGPVGRNPVPEAQSGWRGAGSGGCGIWATAMCNRVLGSTSPTSPVTEAEWNGLADALHLSERGGTTSANETAYYRSRGWCVEDRKFHGTADDYAEIASRRDVDHCDVKFDYFRRTSDGYTNGHVETVVGTSGATAVTNSWGHEATISGGSDGRFSHSGDGVWFGDDAGNRLWPADETDVWVTYVCECRLTRMERLAQLIFGD